MKINTILIGVVSGLLLIMGIVIVFIFLSPQNNNFKKNSNIEKEVLLVNNEDKQDCIDSVGYIWDEKEKECLYSGIEHEKQVEEFKNNTSKNEKYIVAEKSDLILGGGREHKFFSIYDLEGALVNTVNLPSDATPNTANSKGTFGNKIYYLSGSAETTSIAELNPMTGESHIFQFTKTESTNVGNVLAAIVGWTVSDNNQLLAWIDTECTIYIANNDGTNLKKYKSSDGNCISTDINFSKDGESIYVWDGVNDFIRELNIDNGTFSNIVKSENGLFLISPSNRYIIYSNFDTPLSIRDLVSNENINITTPEGYDFYYLQNFAVDEKTVYFKAAIMHGIETDYAIQTDGSNLRDVTNQDNDQEIGAFLSKPKYNDEYFVGLINRVIK